MIPEDEFPYNVLVVEIVESVYVSAELDGGKFGNLFVESTQPV